VHTLLFFLQKRLVYVLFVHKKSVSKRKVCIILIKNLKFKKPKKTYLVGFLGGIFRWVFGWVIYCQPCDLCRSWASRSRRISASISSGVCFLAGGFFTTGSPAARWGVVAAFSVLSP
jgi:hypothetical protein